MGVREYIKSKEVTREELEDNFFVSNTFTVVRGVLAECGNCKHQANTKLVPSESWTSALYCWECDSITLMTHADRMGGNHTDHYTVYTDKGIR